MRRPGSGDSTGTIGSGVLTRSIVSANARPSTMRPMRIIFFIALFALSCRTAITPGNVERLKPAWTYHTGESSFVTRNEKKSAFEATPILVDGLLVFATPFNVVIALDPAT